SSGPWREWTPPASSARSSRWATPSWWPRSSPARSPTSPSSGRRSAGRSASGSCSASGTRRSRPSWIGSRRTPRSRPTRRWSPLASDSAGPPAEEPRAFGRRGSFRFGLGGRHVAAPALLDPVHGQVGLAQQFLGVLRVVGEGGHPEGGVHPDLLPAREDVGVVPKGGADLARPDQGLGLGRLREHADEFVTAVADRHVDRAQGAAEDLADGGEDRRAHLMAVAIVDPLEVIEVE